MGYYYNNVQTRRPPLLSGKSLIYHHFVDLFHDFPWIRVQQRCWVVADDKNPKKSFGFAGGIDVWNTICCLKF